MRKVGPFSEYDANDRDDTLACVKKYLMHLTGKDQISNMEAVAFIGKHNGNVQFIIDTMNYSICEYDFMTYIAPYLTVYLTNFDINCGITTVDVPMVGKAASRLYTKENLGDALSSVLSEGEPTSKEDLANRLMDNMGLNGAIQRYKAKCEKVVYLAVYNVQQSNPQNANLIAYLKSHSYFVNHQLGNYVVKVLPTSSHIPLMMLADNIFQCF